MSIQEAAEAVVEAMDFHGEVTVSFGRRLGCLEPPCRRLCPDAPKALNLAAGGLGALLLCPGGSFWESWARLKSRWGAVGLPLVLRP